MKEEKQVKLINSLLFRFIAIFVLFAFVIVGLTSVAIYKTETELYTNEAKTDLISVTNQIEQEILLDEDEFAEFVHFLIENRDNAAVKIDKDFDGWDEDLNAFNVEFHRQFPDSVYGDDMTFSDLPFDLKCMFVRYNIKYYILLFEGFRDTFNLPYTYFIVPTGNGEECIYFIDVERLEDENNPGKILFFDIWEESHDDCPMLWEIWETGVENKNAWDVFDNEFGKTYSYYKPLYVNGVKLGLICADVDINNVEDSIFIGTINIARMMLLVLLLSMAFMIFIIYHNYLKRIATLKDMVSQYTDSKDVSIAKTIDSNNLHNDEIARLSQSISEMISEIDMHIKKIKYINKELTDTKRYAHDMEFLANIDALTGLRNRLAFNERVVTLKEEIKKGTAYFSLVLIDLNFLKKINDAYGHDKGDSALEKTAKFIETVFGREDSYRIGGDEFMVIYENQFDLDAKLDKFRQMLAEQNSPNEWENISVALGVAEYDKSRNDDFDAVFERADKQMYENKKQMKAERV